MQDIVWMTDERPVESSDEIPVLVMVHDAPGSGADFQRLTSYLLAENVRVVRITMPGFADTTDNGAPVTSMTTEGRARLILNVITYLGAAEVILVGHGFGGLWTVRAATMDLTKRIVGIALLSSFGLHPPASIGTPDTWSTMSGLYKVPTFPTLLGWMSLIAFSRLGYVDASVDDCVLASHMHALLVWAEQRTAVRALRVPVFTAFATDNPVIDRLRLEQLEQAVPSGPRFVYQGGGHKVHEVHAAELALALAQFARSFDVWIPRDGVVENPADQASSEFHSVHQMLRPSASGAGRDAATGDDDTGDDGSAPVRESIVAFGSQNDNVPRPATVAAGLFDTGDMPMFGAGPGLIGRPSQDYAPNLQATPSVGGSSHTPLIGILSSTSNDDMLPARSGSTTSTTSSTSSSRKLKQGNKRRKSTTSSSKSRGAGAGADAVVLQSHGADTSAATAAMVDDVDQQASTTLDNVDDDAEPALATGETPARVEVSELQAALGDDASRSDKQRRSRSRSGSGSSRHRRRRSSNSGTAVPESSIAQRTRELQQRDTSVNTVVPPAAEQAAMTQRQASVTGSDHAMLESGRLFSFADAPTTATPASTLVHVGGDDDDNDNDGVSLPSRSSLRRAPAGSSRRSSASNRAGSWSRRVKRDSVRLPPAMANVASQGPLPGNDDADDLPEGPLDADSD